MKDYFDYFEYPDGYNENRNNLLSEAEEGEKSLEEEEDSGSFGRRKRSHTYLSERDEQCSAPVKREGEVVIAKRIEDGKENI